VGWWLGQGVGQGWGDGGGHGVGFWDMGQMDEKVGDMLGIGKSRSG